MIGKVAFLMVLILIFAAAIGCAEFLDRRAGKRHRKLLNDSVRRKGEVINVERRGLLEGGSPYPWRVRVGFEYKGRKYFVVQGCVSKPKCAVGDRVSVLVDISDPNGSLVTID